MIETSALPPATAGLAPLVPGDGATRLLMRLVAGAEKLNRRCARLGDPAIYDNGDFPFVAHLAACTPAIRNELDRVMQRRTELPPIQSISPDAASITSDAGWKTFIFTAYGINSPANIALCPHSWRAVRAIPGMRTAMFSVLEPGKRLPPHRGPYNGVLRLHLGLDVPAVGAGICVAGEQLRWNNGDVLIFDDSFEHSAWNDSAQPRVVLFVDFVRPLRFPANLINAALLGAARHSSFLRRAKAELRRWEAQFHGAAA